MAGWLADAGAFDRWRMGPGDELMALDYPHGLSANRAGFLILRLGRISSWPLTPIRHFPTIPSSPGVLVQEVQSGGQGIDLGVVVHADYVRETIALLDQSGD